MSFSRIPWPGVLLGLVALAGLLFVLQRLRVRHRRLDVVTTLFWKEALEESRARVFVRRFRHPWAWVLAVAVASLLWLGIAGPRLEDGNAPETVILLDASAAMKGGERLASAIAATRTLLEELPPRRREVLACGGVGRTLLAPGEDALLFEARAEDLVPEASPSSLDRTLLARAATARGATEFVLVGAALPSKQVLELLPENCTVSRVEWDADSAPAANVGIVSVGAAPAKSGRWDRVDALVVLEGNREGAAAAAVLRATLDGTAIDEVIALEGDAAGRVRREIRDLPAAGGTLTVSLAEVDATPADDAASLVLPRRRRLRVGLSENVPASVRRALSADPGIELQAEAAPDVVVRASGEPYGGSAPALELVPAKEQEEAFLLLYSEARDATEVLEEVVGRLGLDDVDATELATKGGRPILLGARAAARRGFRVWDELTGPGYDFTGSRAFPLFCAAVVRWLAEPEPFVASVRAGRAVAGESTAWTDAEGRRHDPLGHAFVPPRAGAYRDDAGRRLEASLGGVAAPSTAIADDAVPVRGEEGSGPDLLTLLCAAALGLVLLDWWAHRTGRIP